MEIFRPRLTDHHIADYVLSKDFCIRFEEECGESENKAMVKVFCKVKVDTRLGPKDCAKNPERWVKENTDYLFAKDLEFDFSRSTLLSLNGLKKYKHCVYY